MIQNSHQCSCTKHIRKEHNPYLNATCACMHFLIVFMVQVVKKKKPMNVKVWNYTSWLCKKKVVKSIGVHYQPSVYKKMPRKV
jgi:hypothetical protein